MYSVQRHVKVHTRALTGASLGFGSLGRMKKRRCRGGGRGLIQGMPLGGVRTEKIIIDVCEISANDASCRGGRSLTICMPLFKKMLAVIRITSAPKPCGTFCLSYEGLNWKIYKHPPSPSSAPSSPTFSQPNQKANPSPSPLLIGIIAQLEEHSFGHPRHPRP